MTFKFRASARPSFLATLFVSVTLLSSTTATDAHADEKSFEADLFQPAIGPRNFLTLDAPEVPSHLQLSFGLFLDFQSHPYKLKATDGNTGLALPTAYPIANQFKSDLTAALGLFDRFQLGLALPFTFRLTGDEIDPTQGMGTGQRISVSGIGDLRVEGKGQILSAGDDDQFVLAGIVGGTLPTGDQNAYLGAKGPTGRGKAVASFQLGRIRFGGQLGLILQETTTTLSAKVGSQLLYGAAASFQARKTIEVLGEFVGRSGFADFTKRYWDENPVEVDVALRVYPTGMLALTGGLGAGLGKGLGAPAGRAFVGAVFTPDFHDADKDGVYDSEDKCPDQAEDRDGYKDKDGCPDPDNDGDSIPDVSDKCPDAAEDLDQFEDADGCPELDNDKDGVPDLNDPCPNAAEDGRGKRPKDGCPSSSEDADGDGVNDTIDKCPDEPEDRDGFEDEDGCPDPDNDGDGIPDGFDNCPNVAEDADSFEDEDGCPELDNDKDGILDKQDKCPDKAETLNLNQDEDGCPDAGEEVVVLNEDHIAVTEKIPFSVRGGVTDLKEGGHNIAALVALVMNGHPEIRKLAIEVRSDKLSKEDTQKRAELIRQAISKRGVAPERLLAVGAGPGGNGVDFHITEKSTPKPAPAAQPAPAPGSAQAPPADGTAVP